MKSFFRDVLKVILVVGTLLGFLLILVLMELSGFWNRGGLSASAPPVPPASVSAAGAVEGGTAPVGSPEGEGQTLGRQFLIWVLGEPEGAASSGSERVSP